VVERNVDKVHRSEDHDAGLARIVHRSDFGNGGEDQHDEVYHPDDGKNQLQSYLI
jgi:hypothetical protein